MHKKKDTKNYFFLLTEQNRNAKGNKLDMTEHNYTVLFSESIRNKRSPLSPHYPPSSCPDGVTVQFYIKVEIVHIWKGGGEIINDHSSTSARIREREGGGRNKGRLMFYKVRRTRGDNWKEFNNPENNLWLFFVCFREKHDLQSPSNYTGNEKSQNIRCFSSHWLF